MKEFNVEFEYKKQTFCRIIIPKKHENDLRHIREREITKILLETFGGEFEFILETDHKTPDLLWNGEKWEIKMITSKTSLDNQVRKGLKQIRKDGKGLILDITNSNLKNEEISEGILYRMNRSLFDSLDVVFIREEKIERIIRYKK